jgi:ubiquinone/menaquinone biosynthesis C-methylase UbiE
VPVSLLMYAMIVVLVPYFRWRRPELVRPYRAPMGSFLPVFVAAFFLIVLYIWLVHDPAGSLASTVFAKLRWLLSFVFFSIPIYLTLTYFYDPDSLISTMSFFSRLNLWFENLFIPHRLRREMMEFFTNSRGRHVLEFGSGVGTLTVHLAEHVGHEGKVYAVDLSKSNIDIIQKRLNRLGHSHVELIHDPHLVNRIHPNVHNVDLIVSINNLGYIQDVKKVLREMNNILPNRGRIYFVEYVDLFYFLPNPKWLSDPEQVRRIFADAGFVVTVKVRRGLFWNYLYIYGIKENPGTIYI